MGDRREDVSRGRTWTGALAAALITAVTLTALISVAPAARAATPTLRVVGNHFVDAHGRPMRLFALHLGGGESVCVQPLYDGFRRAGIFDQAVGDGTFEAMRSWHANAVRISLNEQCWLGVNPVLRRGVPVPGITPLSGAAALAAGAALRRSYQAAVAAAVAAAHRHDLAVILDLHWSAARDAIAFDQWPLPDRQHAIPFWRSVAHKFRTDRSVAFELFNEPFQRDPLTGRAVLSWRCLRDGCAGVPNACADCYDGSDDRPSIDGCGARCPTEVRRVGTRVVPAARGTYLSAGTQSLVDTIRSAGARQPILVPGRDYTNDLGQWLRWMPFDPLHQLAASFHAYQGTRCGTPTCWDREVAPVAARVPVVTTEFGGDLSGQTAPCLGVIGYDDQFMIWADRAGVSYTGFAWDEDFGDHPYPSCSYDLLAAADGQPRYGQGQAIHDHFLAVAGR